MDSLLKQVILAVKNVAHNELLPRFAHVSGSPKHDGSLLSEADCVVQDSLLRLLLSDDQSYGFLAEEMSQGDQQQALAFESVWCIDPLDGTTNFVGGVPFFCISIALIINRVARMGVVYDPIRQECFTAVKNQGAYLNDNSLALNSTCNNLNQALAYIDLKRLPDAMSHCLISQTPFASQRNIGSVALEWCWLAAGRGQLYLHGKQSIWDYAAGNLIFQEAGGVSSSFDGDSVFNYGLQPRSAIAATNKPLYHQWFDWLTQIL